jgi:hypothetical protein
MAMKENKARNRSAWNDAQSNGMEEERALYASSTAWHISVDTCII